MTLVQLDYLVAVDTHRHFAKAAAACFVTQPTLSMQLQKLEEELGIKMFDRSKQPVVTTQVGTLIIAQARKILTEKNNLFDFLHLHKGVLAGELKVGVKLIINELTTDLIIIRLKEGKIDTGILVTPLNEPGIKEQVLFYEAMLAYVSAKNAMFKKTYVLPQDIDPNKLWLLEEGHCFRTQIANLCQLRRASAEGSHFEYEAGSLETLRRLVEMNDGITILPELATFEMTAKQKSLLRKFRQPVPMREVSIVTHRDHIKKTLIEILKKEIIESLPEKVLKNKAALVVPI